MTKTSTGRKWIAEALIGRVIVAEGNRELIGTVQSHQHGIGFLCMDKPWWSKANNYQRKQLVTEQIEALMKKKQMAVVIQ